MGSKHTERRRRQRQRARQRERAEPNMSFRDAMDLVPDDLPDGAFFAMAHDIAGLEYGEGFYELGGEQ